MLAPVSNNGLIAAMFGSGVARGLRGVGAPASEKGTAPVRSASDATYPQPVDTLELSDAARGEEPHKVSSGQPAANAKELTPEEEAKVEELRERDQEVRRHEQAHKAAAGSHASGGPTYQYETGPDGRSYAVEGEVGIDTSEVRGDPQATIIKMQQVQSAATAPATPSSQDRAVAAKAAAIEREARAELAEQRRAETFGSSAEIDGPGKATSPDSGTPEAARAAQGEASTINSAINPIQAPGALLDIAA